MKEAAPSPQEYVVYSHRASSYSLLNYCREETFSPGSLKYKDKNVFKRCWKWKEAMLWKFTHFNFEGSERKWKWLWESKKNESLRSWTWPLGRTDTFCAVLPASNPHHLHKKKGCKERRLLHNIQLERMIHLLYIAHWVTRGYHGSGSLTTSNAKHAEREWRLCKGTRDDAVWRPMASCFVEAQGSA